MRNVNAIPNAMKRLPSV